MQIPDDDSGYILYKRHPVYNHLFCGTNGEIYSINKGFLYGTVTKKGYKRCSIKNRKTVFWHRLIMTCYQGNSDLTIDHIDGNKFNNSLKNLEYVTNRENFNRSVKTGLRTWDKVRGELNANSKLSEEIVLKIIKMRHDGIKCRQISDFLNIEYGCVKSVYTGQSWKHIPRPNYKN